MTETKTIAVVTGAGGDIGRAIVAGLKAPERIVIAADISFEAAQASAKALGDADGEVVAMTCDVTDVTSIANMASEIAQLGTVSVLVNNAGGVTAASLQSADPQSFRADLELNLEAAFNCFKAFETPLKACQGSVVNIASANGVGAFGHPGYSIAKAGLMHLTRMIAVEYGKFGIRANAVAPGTVRTQAWNERAERNPQLFEEVNRWYALGRIARAEDVASAVAFLASPAAQAITGVVLPVDCGLTAGLAETARQFGQSDDY